MRFQVPELFLGCFLTVAVFAMGTLFARQEQTASPAQPQSRQETTAESSKTQNPDTELTGSMWLTKDAAGFFTFALVIVGIGQAVLFFVQLRYMRTGMDDATMAARAAQTSAETAKEQVELTKLGVFALNRAYLDATVSEAKTQFIADPRPPSGYFRPGDPMEICAKITLKNSGKTRGVIVQAYGEFRTGTWLPPVPNYDTAKGRTYVADFSISDAEALPFPWNFKTSEVVEQFFFGSVLYKDIFGRGHVSRFCMRILPSHENGGDARMQLAGNDAWRECD
ncbi:MAG: hypothetical protein P4M05_04470 [Bradyrhizobium sp.]|nr:hypothetical protein [Bradyrhizobium sp.]